MADAAPADRSDRGMSMMDEQNTIDYSILKSPESIVFPTNRPIREIPLTPDGEYVSLHLGLQRATPVTGGHDPDTAG